MAKMSSTDRNRYDARARIIKAIAHPTRLFIVDELSRGERCVCELTEMIGSDMSTVSKHLSLLRTAGIVQHDKRGSQVYYITCSAMTHTLDQYEAQFDEIAQTFRLE